MAGGTFRGGKGGEWGLGSVLEQMSIDLRSKMEGLPEAIEDVMTDESERMVEEIEGYIRTRRARTSPPAGRIQSRDMIDSVAFKESGGETQFTIRVGYLVNRPHWAELQEHGFTHWKSGEFIEGTRALTDAYIAGRERITARLAELGTRRQF